MRARAIVKAIAPGRRFPRRVIGPNGREECPAARDMNSNEMLIGRSDLGNPYDSINRPDALLWRNAAVT
jgi:hypothetical protein